MSVFKIPPVWHECLFTSACELHITKFLDEMNKERDRSLYMNEDISPNDWQGSSRAFLIILRKNTDEIPCYENALRNSLEK